MSMIVQCNGCGNTFKPGSSDHAISGERTNGLGGGGLPNGRFDWCMPCAQVAFEAVAQCTTDRRLREAGYVGRFGG
ncbi:hypothetical protein [Thermomonospora cellulosilytica]|uniref:Uncharacterized protein n=1 Tax=Thermomonospora cellulosilytica TaxID=1411118 RepID=A0A7W3N1T7_9ACTN|nr:hypothetical protein [Thermomonospora cellulosilytica]MBA9005914.1 hypothetical protein [Thermomonospora cellulosilytica]